MTLPAYIDSFLAHINTCPGNWYASIDLIYFFFSILASKDHQKKLTLIWQGQELTSQFYIIT